MGWGRYWEIPAELDTRQATGQSLQEALMRESRGSMPRALFFVLVGVVLTLVRVEQARAGLIDGQNLVAGDDRQVSPDEIRSAASWLGSG